MTDKQRERYQKARRDFAEFIKLYPFEIEDLSGEQWKPIPNYAGLYQVSTFGRVKSYKTDKPRILRPVINKNNYLTVHLWQNNKVKMVTVHRLVALAFIPNPLVKPQVNHKDGCKLNACVSNLEWVTNAENIQHAFDTGLEVAPQGEECYNAKLTPEQVRHIRENPNGLNTIELAKQFGVTAATISDVQLGKKYKTAGGQVRKPKKKRYTPKIPTNIRDEIRQLYVPRSKDFNSVALEKIYEYCHTTILRIVRDN
ncbi:MAG: HNH endonuclease [Selenomonadaceae bacterium]|nr:HNH endonuclease [Selenomonadaceae bacterium]